MALEFTQEELRELAALVAPIIKSTAKDVGSEPLVESLEGITTLPAVCHAGGTTRVVRVPLTKLQGPAGEKGDALEFAVLGSYDTLEALMRDFPNGHPRNGFFKVGGSPYVWTGNKYEPLNLDVFRTFSLEQFTEIQAAGNGITVDHSRTPYAKVTLAGEKSIFNLAINNTSDGDVGKVLVFQTGFKQIALASNIKGSIDLPLNGDTIALLTYHRLGDTIYMYSNTVLGDIQYPTPQKVKDMVLVYSDSSSCTIRWTAPHANHIYDKVTEYDIRYANSPVDPEDGRTWAGLKQPGGAPPPAAPGELQTMTVTGLSPGKEYYLYLKSVKVNYGAKYASEASGFVYFRTLGSEDPRKAYRIDLGERNFLTQANDASAANMTDEKDRNIFLESGYPDIKNKNFQTAWETGKYSRTNSPYGIIIDLFDRYALDKLFVYSGGKPKFSVFTMKDFGHPWEKAGQVEIAYNEWKSIDFGGKDCRFIRLYFDLMDFGEHASPALGQGEEGFPSDEYNMTIDKIHNLLLYGRKTSSKPEGIMPPARRAAARRTVDQWFCTNGHAYQQGRIHSMCSGEKARIYIHYGHFCSQKDGKPEAFDRLADMTFRISRIPWVAGNNGTGENLEALLRDTYKRHGIRPYLANTGVMDYCRYPGANYNRPVDDYWIPGAWKPLPQRGVGGAGQVPRRDHRRETLRDVRQSGVHTSRQIRKQGGRRGQAALFPRRRAADKRSRPGQRHRAGKRARCGMELVDRLYQPGRIRRVAQRRV